MNSLIDLLRQAEGTAFTNEDGIKSHLKLLAPLAEEELATIESNLPCPLPQDIRELLKFACGFEGTWLEEIKFADVQDRSLGLEDVFPRGVPIAHDGLGNYWVVDLTRESQSWGPIFYACHDAPVIVYQTDSLLHFVQEVIREGNEPWKSEIQAVWGPLSNRIWDENPGVLSFAQCAGTEDNDLRAFAKTLDETWQFIDLRSPSLGDGFSWGRYGAKTLVKRFGEKRIFAYQKKSIGRRFLDAL